MFGFEEYYIGLIEEAKSPEEIKKILNYQFVQGKGVPERVLDAVFDIDPTKKKSYTRWTLMQWEKYSNEILKALSNGRLKKMFDTFKKREADGLNLANMESFEKAMEYIPDVDPILDKEGDPDSPENDFDVVYDSPEWTIAVPHTYEANRKLGVGCRWCTAGAFGDNDSWWNRYSPAGPIFVNFDKRHSEIAPMDRKEYPYTRYQFLFEWMNWSGELMDSDDHRVDFDRIDMPEDVIDFYGEENERYRDMIENGAGDPEERRQEYEEDRFNEEILLLNIRDMRYIGLLPEQNEEMNLNVDYMLYDEEDTSDPVISNYFDRNDYFVCKSADEQAIVIKDISGQYICVYWNDAGNGNRYSYSSFDVQELDDYWDTTYLFFGRYSDNLYILPKEDKLDSENYHAMIDVDNEFGDSSIENIYINPYVTDVAEKAGIEGCYGIACEVVFSDMSHGLFLYDAGNVITMIRKDVPSGDAYVPVFKDGQLHIAGKRFDYKFGVEWEADESNLSLFEDLGEYNGEDFCIVLCGKNKNEYNLYNATSKQLVFSENCTNIETGWYGGMDFLICKFANSSAIYSLDYKKFVVNPCNEIHNLFKRESVKLYYKYWCAEGDDGYTIYTAENGFESVIKVANVNKTLISSDHKPYCIVHLKNGDLNVVDLEEKRLTVKDGGFITYGAMPTNYGGVVQANICFFQKEEQKPKNVCNIYNFVTGELVYENYNIGKGTPKMLIAGGNWEPRWRVCSDNGYNIIGTDGKPLLPHDVTEILNTTSTNPPTIPVVDKNRMWLLDPDLNMYPTKDGIDLDVFRFVGTEYSNCPEFEYKGFRFKIKPENGSFDNLYVTPPQGRGYSKEIENEIRSLLFKRQAEIRESFNRVFNMINNFYKDKE